MATLGSAPRTLAWLESADNHESFVIYTILQTALEEAQTKLILELKVEEKEYFIGFY